MPAIVTGSELAAHLGGTPDTALCDLCADAASDAVAVVVDPLDPDDVAAEWSAPVRYVGLMTASDLYQKGVAGPGGTFQLDEFTTANLNLTSNLLHKYGAVLASDRAVGGLAG